MRGMLFRVMSQLNLAHYVTVWALLSFGANACADASIPHCCRVNSSRLWNRTAHGLNPAAGEKVAPLLNYQFLLPERQLASSLSYYGTAVRLRRFVNDLMSGSRPLKIGAIGGSITAGNCAEHPKDTWFSVVSSWMSSASNANITARNGAVSATPSAYFVLCLTYSVDPDVDLVFVEFAMNDGYEDGVLDNQVVMTMERLLRRIMELPNKPAVVLVQHPILSAKGFYWRYYKTSEHLQGANSVYYDVPTVSPHTAFFQLSDQQPTEGWLYKQVFSGNHPGSTGHKAIADTVVNLVQMTALDLLQRPFSPEEADEVHRPLPLPLYTGNVPPTTSACAVGSDLTAMVLTSQGWSWVNEGTEQKPKWGYVATVPGNILVLKFNTVRPNLPPDARVPVVIFMLMSYTSMGWARLECVRGCTCKPSEVDTHIEAKVSQTYPSRLIVSQAPQCRIQVTVMNKTTSGGHKVKVTGIVVTDQPESAPLFMQSLKLPQVRGR